jgi:hypothetical protein
VGKGMLKQKTVLVNLGGEKLEQRVRREDVVG